MTGTAVLLWTPSDLTTLRKMANSSLPTIDELEELENEISTLPVPYATVDHLSEKTGLDDISTRVGVHLLHEAGAIQQGVDVAAKAFLAIPGSLQRIAARFGEEAAAEVQSLSSASDLSAPGRGVIDVLDMAAHLEEDPSALEHRLLSLAESEVVGYRPFLRAMSLMHGDSDWDRSEMDETLRRLRRSSFDRLEAMKLYAERRMCRRAQLLAHFDEDGIAECGFCDVCVGEPEPMRGVDPIRYADVDVVTEQVAQAITGIVREASRLGSALGRGSFVKGLKGTSRWATYETPQVLQRSRWFGSLRYLTETEINEAIDTLVDRGSILALEHAHSGGGTYVGLDVRL
jgi:superfamily II DNA helicase RecQ